MRSHRASLLTLAFLTSACIGVRTDNSTDAETPPLASASMLEGRAFSALKVDKKHVRVTVGDDAFETLRDGFLISCEKMVKPRFATVAPKPKNTCGVTGAREQAIAICEGYKWLALADSFGVSAVTKRGEITAVRGNGGAPADTHLVVAAPTVSDRATFEMVATDRFQSAAIAGAESLNPGRCPDAAVSSTVAGADENDGLSAAAEDRVRLDYVLAVATAESVRMMRESADTAAEHLRAAADTIAADGSASARIHRWRGRHDSRLEAMRLYVGVPVGAFEDAQDDANKLPVPLLRPQTESQEKAIALLRESGADPRQDAAALKSVMVRLTTARLVTLGLSASDVAKAASAKVDAVAQQLPFAAAFVVEQAAASGKAIEPIESEDGLARVRGTEESSDYDAAAAAVLFARTAGSHYDAPRSPGDEPTAADAERAATGDDEDVAGSRAPLLDAGDRSLKSAGVFGTAAYVSSELSLRMARLREGAEAADQVIALTNAALRNTVAYTSEICLSRIEGPSPNQVSSTNGTVGSVRIRLFGASDASKFALWAGADGLTCAQTGKVNGATCSAAQYQLAATPTPVAGTATTLPGIEWVITGQSFPGATSASKIPFGRLVFVTERRSATEVAVVTGYAVGQGGLTSTGASGAYEACGVGPAGGDVIDTSTTHSGTPTPGGRPSGGNRSAQDSTGTTDDPSNECGAVDARVRKERRQDSGGFDNTESSFNFYIDDARRAAAEADALGEELINQGFQMDTMAQQSRDELEALCGGNINVDSLHPSSCTDNAQCASGHCTDQTCEVGDLTDLVMDSPDAEGARECLGASAGGEGSVNLSLGNYPLCLWHKTSRDGTELSTPLPPCVCEAGDDCQASCPQRHERVSDCSGLSKTGLPEGYKWIATPTTALRMKTGAADEFLAQAEASDCVALAKIRAGEMGNLLDSSYPNGIHDLDIYENGLLQQWATFPNFRRAAESVGFRPDMFEVATVTKNGAAWLTTGWSMSGANTEFPCAPFFPKDSEAFATVCGGGEQPNGRSILCGGVCSDQESRRDLNYRLFRAVVALAALGNLPNHPNGNDDAAIYQPAYTLSPPTKGHYLRRFPFVTNPAISQSDDNDGSFEENYGNANNIGPSTPFTVHYGPFVYPMLRQWPLVAGQAWNVFDSSWDRVVAEDTAHVELWDAPEWIDANAYLAVANFNYNEKHSDNPFRANTGYCVAGNDPIITDTTFEKYGYAACPTWFEALPLRFRNAPMPVSDVVANDWRATMKYLIVSMPSNVDLHKNASLVQGSFSGITPFLLRAKSVDVYGSRGIAETSDILGGEFQDAVELACLNLSGETAPTGGGSTLQSVRSVDDFPRLAGMLEEQARIVQRQLDNMMLVSVPAQVARDLQQTAINPTFPANRGAYGEAIAGLRGQIESNISAVSQIATTLRDFSADIKLTELAIKQYDLKADSLAAEDAMASLELQMFVREQSMRCVKAMLAPAENGALGWVDGSNEAKAVEAAIECSLAAAQITTAVATHELKKRIGSNAQESNDADKTAALISLSAKFGGRLDSISQAYRSFSAAYAETQSLLARIDTIRSQARHSIADVVLADRDFTGREYHVNRVMRARMNTIRIRYEAKLQEAIRKAALAREAVEQRFAVDLQTTTDWAGRLCQFRGIDYDQLRDTSKDPQMDWAAYDAMAHADETHYWGGANHYANSYIGDYVSMLEDYVRTGYGTKHPYTDGQGTTVLSIRDNIEAVTTICDVPGPNLLYNSGKLIPLAAPGQRGWSIEKAPGSSGLETLGGTSPLFVSPALSAGVQVGLKRPWVTGAQMATPPGAWLTQSVTLNPGTYALSWYEPANVTRLSVDVVNSAKSTILPIPAPAPTFLPLDAAETKLGYRRAFIKFTVQTTGKYDVRFTVKAVPTQTAAPLAWVGAIQLEATTLSASLAPWVATTSKLTMPGVCEDINGDAFRAKWTASPGCANATLGECFYELPFDITLADIKAGLSGRVAGRRNYNHRFNSLGVNIVGTGIRNCRNAGTATQDCYANNTLRYSLTHEGANNTFVVSNADAAPFAFPDWNAVITDASALAQERFLTYPVLASDQSAMQAVTTIDYRGRTMAGHYILTVFDAPGLNWDALEDVQLYVDYEYWSPSY